MLFQLRNIFPLFFQNLTIIIIIFYYCIFETFIHIYNGI